MIRAFLFFVIAVFGCGAALGEKPHATSNHKHANYFGDRHWTHVRDHFNAQMRMGKCPLGFVGKDGGCQLADQTRKWVIGKRLPPSAIRFDVAPALASKLGKPPSGHRYVRVGADILLVSNRTGVVVDAILDLGRK